jgi:hypothetical protein
LFRRTVGALELAMRSLLAGTVFVLIVLPAIIIGWVALLIYLLISGQAFQGMHEGD